MSCFETAIDLFQAELVSVESKEIESHYVLAREPIHKWNSSSDCYLLIEGVEHTLQVCAFRLFSVCFFFYNRASWCIFSQRKKHTLPSCLRAPANVICIMSSPQMEGLQTGLKGGMKIPFLLRRQHQQEQFVVSISG